VPLTEGFDSFEAILERRWNNSKCNADPVFHSEDTPYIWRHKYVSWLRKCIYIIVDHKSKTITMLPSFFFERVEPKQYIICNKGLQFIFFYTYHTIYTLCCLHPLYIGDKDNLGTYNCLRCIFYTMERCYVLCS
jgi:hypothetical protein